MDEEINLNFIRHGKHNTSQDEELGSFGLLEEGVAEARYVGERLDLNPDFTVAFTTENSRSIASSFLALYPGEELVEHNIDRCMNVGKIRPSPQLGYKRIHDPVFSSKLGQAFKEGVNLAFLIEHSDRYRLSTEDKISSYTAMAYEIATIVEKYTKVCRNWTQRTSGRNEHLVLQRIFCAREFIYPSFRAKLFELMSGIDARDAYVNWYCENMEREKDARTGVSSVSIEHIPDSHPEDKITIADEYGSTVIDLSQVYNIIAEYEELFS